MTIKTEIKLQRKQHNERYLHPVSIRVFTEEGGGAGGMICTSRDSWNKTKDSEKKTTGN